MYQQSSPLEQSLEQRIPVEGLDAEYRTFYDFWVTRRPAGQPGD